MVDFLVVLHINRVLKTRVVPNFLQNVGFVAHREGASGILYNGARNWQVPFDRLGREVAYLNYSETRSRDE
jgi:hypothetical protein